MRIVITGGNSGIGRAAAIHLARKGHDVVATARRPEAATKLSAAIEAESLPITIERLDVSDDDSVRLGFQRILAAGEVDVLVNNAGVGDINTLEDAPIERWKDVYDTNVFGPVRCSQAVLPHMRERGRGHICMISSIVGRFASVGQAVYTSSKSAMEGYSEVLALEVARFGIRVSIVEPGVTRTAILAKNATAPDSAYAGVYEREFAMYTSLIPTAPGPELTAQVIEDAITSTEPKLRWRSGPDAELLLDGREQMSDADFLALGDPDNDGYIAVWKERFGIDLTPGFES